MSNEFAINFGDIQKAAQAIEQHIVHTPFLRSETFSSLLASDIFLKFENLQFTASFKERGALNRILNLSENEKSLGVIAASAGNHAQGVAYHATRFKIPSKIVMPRFAPLVKVAHTRSLGAEVILFGDNFDEAREYTKGLASESGLQFIHPYDDPLVMAGQGTIAVEMLAVAPELDSLIVPIGGGGLISGVAIAAKAIKPDIEIIGVETKRFSSMHDLIKGATSKYGGTTIADGIAVKEPGKLTSVIVKKLVDDIVLVDEGDIEESMIWLLEIEKTLVEGAGAAGLAALRLNKSRFQGKKIGLILCGGNVDPLTLSAIIERGMARSGRLARLTVQMPDLPGSLAAVSKILGESDANIDEVHHQRTFTTLPVQSAEVEIAIKTRDHEHISAVVDRLEKEGFVVKKTNG